MKGLSKMGRAIIQAQPAMAPLFNLVNRTLLEIDKAKTIEEVRFGAKKVARHFVKASTEAWKRIADHVDTVLGKGSTVLTHSYSATLFLTLVALHHRGRGFSVICTESRPLREGVTLARRLAENDIPVQLTVDSAAFQLLDRVSLVFVGADTISPAGVINKIGTRGLAVAAHYQNVPFYVLTGTEKCLAMAVRPSLEKEMKPPSEIVENGGSMEVLNFYFDFTPLQLVSGVVTEKGIWKAEELRRYLEELKIHPFLADQKVKRR